MFSTYNARGLVEFSKLGTDERTEKEGTDGEKMINKRGKDVNSIDIDRASQIVNNEREISSARMRK